MSDAVKRIERGLRGEDLLQKIRVIKSRSLRRFEVESSTTSPPIVVGKLYSINICLHDTWVIPEYLCNFCSADVFSFPSEGIA